MSLKLPNSDESFSYYLPHKKLYQYISYYSIQHNSFSSISPVFIPDLGGSIIISLGRKGFDMVVWGPFNRLTAIENGPKDISVQFFIEFQPGGLSRFILPNSQEILNKKVSLRELDNDFHFSLRQIFERNFHSADQIIFCLDHFFLNLLDKRRDYLVNGRNILCSLQDFMAMGTMEDLSKDVHYSTRHINRYLNTLTGVSGKEYMKIKRFNKAVRLLKESNSTIEQISDSLCYYDTAHFIHDFSHLSEISPMLFRENKSDFYNETLKIF
ncbi:helix-turn-helix domain-containing protein [Oscillospiraceae bacterium LTW-04]|nr:AraC family transcriptional regulator [Oscillospiraceae bacterium MB24-C1]